MTISIFLARIFCIYFIVMAFGLYYRREMWHEIFGQLLNNKICFFVLSLMTFTIGILLIVAHSIFVLDWRLLITLLCWLTFIKGVSRLFFADRSLAYAQRMLEKPRFYFLGAVIMLVLGLYMGYFGFIY